MKIYNTIKDVSIKEKYIFQHHSTKGYTFIGFDNYDDVKEWYSKFNIKDRHVSEVIKDGPQRFRFDLEYSDSMSRSEWEDNVERILDNLVYYLKDCNPVRYESIDPSNNKLSEHIVCMNGYCLNSIHAAKISSYVTSNIRNKKIIDFTVYNKLSMFRIEGSTKLGSDRIKYAKGSNALSTNWTDSLISNVTGNPFKIPIINQHVSRRLSYQNS